MRSRSGSSPPPRDLDEADAIESARPLLFFFFEPYTLPLSLRPLNAALHIFAAVNSIPMQLCVQATAGPAIPCRQMFLRLLAAFCCLARPNNSVVQRVPKLSRYTSQIVAVSRLFSCSLFWSVYDCAPPDMNSAM